MRFAINILIIFLFVNCYIFSQKEFIDKNKNNKLRLEIKIMKNIIRFNEDILVEVMLKNNTNVPVLVNNKFLPESFLGFDPFGILVFEIYSKYSQKLKYNGKVNFYDENNKFLGYFPGDMKDVILKKPQLHEFILLNTNFFYGKEIIINKGEFAYGPFNIGKYRIRAKYICNPKIWAKTKYKNEIDEYKKKIAILFEGEIYSNEIEIEIIK